MQSLNFPYLFRSNWTALSGIIIDVMVKTELNTEFFIESKADRTLNSQAHRLQGKTIIFYFFVDRLSFCLFPILHRNKIENTNIEIQYRKTTISIKYALYILKNFQGHAVYHLMAFHSLRSISSRQ